MRVAERGYEFNEQRMLEGIRPRARWRKTSDLER